MAPLPGVSFVVPVYNKAPHLEGVLRQIARQAGDFPRQYVFVDDGSTDDSLRRLKQLTMSWENVVIESQPNRGSAGATNSGIRRADQPYIKFVDADDLIADAATVTLLRALDGSEACLAFGKAIRFGTENEIDLEFAVPSPPVDILSESLRLAMKNSLFNPSQCLARTDAVKEAGGCDERVVHSQEYSLTLRLACRWPLMRVDAPIAFIPNDAVNRLSSNEGRQLQRVTHALALFLRDHPEVNAGLRWFACRRAAGRAWHYVRRREGAALLSGWHRRYLRSLVAPLADAAGFVDACRSAFDSPIRTAG